MKTILSIVMGLCGALYMQAQGATPVYEKDGEMVKATFYHENGAIAQQGYFLNDKLHGDWVMYDVSGKKVAAGQYQFGVKTGKWFFWNEEDLQEVDYNDNQIVSVVRWNNGRSVAINR
jgi:antitoxin component YwqK of YwqJK toxin-antitoxin module